jgi:hypothetical protein
VKNETCEPVFEEMGDVEEPTELFMPQINSDEPEENEEKPRFVRVEDE